MSQKERQINESPLYAAVMVTPKSDDKYACLAICINALIGRTNFDNIDALTKVMYWQNRKYSTQQIFDRFM